MNNVEERYRVSERYLSPYEYDDVGDDGIRRRGFISARPAFPVDMLIEDIGAEMSTRALRIMIIVAAFVAGVVLAW